MAAGAKGLRGRGVEAWGLDRLLLPLHWLVWRHPHRRARKLLRFSETEADGGRDLVRAAELTRDALLRQLYLRHALDEQRHADLFRRRAGALLVSSDGATAIEANWFAPGERGLDDLRIEDESDEGLLAFLHLSERAAARRFAVYARVLASDPETRRVFTEILHDEAFHMSYTKTQLERVSPRRYRWKIWSARASRLWKGYLRVAMALAGLIGTVVLVAQYFLILPLFALAARRAERRLAPGWVKPRAGAPLTSQYG